MCDANVVTMIRPFAWLKTRSRPLPTVRSEGQWPGTRAFVESETWQIEEIKRGLTEADAGEFATDAEVEATFEKWQRIKRDAD